MTEEPKDRRPHRAQTGDETMSEKPNDRVTEESTPCPASVANLSHPAPPKWSAMTPRERDTLVAEKVMGWTRPHEDAPWRTTSSMLALTPAVAPFDWSPTTNPTAMIEVIEAMRNRGWATTVIALVPRGFACDFRIPIEVGMICQQGDADTMPEAVALASLRACGIKVEA